MNKAFSITSKYWRVTRFFKKREWVYWNPIFWNSNRQPRLIQKLRYKLFAN